MHYDSAARGNVPAVSMAQVFELVLEFALESSEAYCMLLASRGAWGRRGKYLERRAVTYHEALLRRWEELRADYLASRGPYLPRSLGPLMSDLKLHAEHLRENARFVEGMLRSAPWWYSLRARLRARAGDVRHDIERHGIPHTLHLYNVYGERICTSQYTEEVHREVCDILARI